MKSRVKKTGKIIDIISIDYLEDDPAILVRFYTEDGYLDSYTFKSLEELSNYLEDYTPKESLIKDEKIRKAVRVWAEANGFSSEIKVEGLPAGTRFSVEHYGTDFLGFFIYDLRMDRTYTIEELCEGGE